MEFEKYQKKIIVIVFIAIPIALIILFLSYVFLVGRGTVDNVFPRAPMGSFVVSPHEISRDDTTVHILWISDAQMNPTVIDYSIDDFATHAETMAVTESIDEKTKKYTYELTLPLSTVGTAYQVRQHNQTTDEWIVSEMQVIK